MQFPLQPRPAKIIVDPKNKPPPKPLEVPEFDKEVELLIKDFSFSKEDIELSFEEEHIKKANLFSVFLNNECISAVLLDQHEKEFLYLGYMSTSDDMRRKGIGKTLMKIIIRFCYMLPDLKDIYLISRNIQDGNGKWYSVKESPVYRFWETLGFNRIPWGKFPHIPSVLDAGTILTQARAYRFSLCEGNYDYVNLPMADLLNQLREQIKPADRSLSVKVFSPLIHHETMTWPPLPDCVLEGEKKIRARFHVDKARVMMNSPYQFSRPSMQHPPVESMSPEMIQQEIQLNSTMLQQMYASQYQMQQMMMMQQFRQMQRQRVMQNQAAAMAAARAAQQQSLLDASTNNNDQNIVPAKRKFDETNDTN